MVIYAISVTARAWLVVARMGLVCLLALAALPVRAGGVGLDHIPIVVRDLSASAADFQALGFTLKDGRSHRNGLQNMHIKFPDGSGLELMSVAARSNHDKLSRHYLGMLEQAQGPVFLSFHARDTPELHKRLRGAGVPFTSHRQLTMLTAPALRYVFFVKDNRAASDRPAHFIHANGALQLRAVWLAPVERQPLVDLLGALGAQFESRHVRAPVSTPALVAKLRSGAVVILPPTAQLHPGRPLVGASFTTRSLADVRRAWAQSGAMPRNTSSADSSDGGQNERLIVPPSHAHGLWLEFREH